MKHQNCRLRPRWPGGLFAVVVVALALGGGSAPGQKTVPVDPEFEKQLGSTWETRTEARTMTLTVPAPRGQIVDRNGKALALTKVENYLALHFPQLAESTEKEVLAYAHRRIAAANRALDVQWTLDDTTILTHYRNRRWLPLPFGEVLAPAQVKTVEPLFSDGLGIYPVYHRYYPHGPLAAHVVGYVGKTRPLPVGPIENGEPYFVEFEGRDGLEVSFDTQLTGRPGKINVLFAADGTKMAEEMVQRPVPGNNVVTTLDLDMQKTAERVLGEKAKRGAFVMVDIYSGDILVLASWPRHNPNDFIPFISKAKFDALQNDPDIPLYARAFRGLYPPASTYKIPVALAALEERVIGLDTYFDCPTALEIGDHVFHNWNKNPEGSMNVVRAITRSCNTFFYRVGMLTKNRPISSISLLLGLGQKTGIPVRGEPDGLVPTDEYWIAKYRYPMSPGDLANMAIGQGELQVSPLQSAQMMAGVAHGESAPRVRLVKQVQGLNNEILESVPVMRREPLNISADTHNIVVRGLIDVVNSGSGTARSAAHDDLEIAGKTGTAQWGNPDEKKYVAWFAGFVPARYPQYAFAALYEGDPLERLSGGQDAAPIAGEFFKSIFKKEEAEELLAEAKAKAEETGLQVATAEIVGAGSGDDGFPGVETAPPAGPPPVEAEKPKTAIGRFFNKFRRR